eukprot:54722_1
MYATAIEHCRKCGMTLDALNKIIRWREHPEFVGQQYQKHHRCIDNNGHDTVLCPEVQSPSRSEDWSSLLSWDVVKQNTSYWISYLHHLYKVRFTQNTQESHEN